MADGHRRQGLGRRPGDHLPPQARVASAPPIQWRGSARYDDVLDIRVETRAIGTTSFTIASEFRRHGAEAILATAETVYVMIDPVARTKVPVTPAQRAALERGAPSIIVDHAGARR